MTTMTLAARTGVAFELPRGGTLRVVNTHGSQVVDTWALVKQDPRRALSTAHTRALAGRLTVRVGDRMVDSSRRPVLAVVEDTTPGVHDTLIPACDRARYEQLGHGGYHANCTDNFRQALAAIDVAGPEQVPGPLNLFMNVPVDDDGGIAFCAPVSEPGDSVALEALTDVIVVLSACPQDLVPVNGELLEPRDVEVRVEHPRAVAADPR
ncbi:DUF1989 domain-containing protein [Streptomyces sp. NPDC059578]|uniref:DUF1989 domain-containing protein n=1 Tax=unclassified Streptomyces TaxID=2593676 RepID=UPI00364925E5